MQYFPTASESKASACEVCGGGATLGTEALDLHGVWSRMLGSLGPQALVFESTQTVESVKYLSWSS